MRHCFYVGGTVLAFWLAGAFSSSAQQLSTNSVTASSAAPTKMNDIVTTMIQEAYHDLDNGDVDNALQGADGAIQLDPQNPAVYELRGTIYIQKKLWERAEQDYNTALSISPNRAVAKYKLAEIKFLQKLYDSARPRYAAVGNDENLGDLAAYKVFLCDLLGGHQDRASSELAVFNRPEGGASPSHFYANAAWALVHNKFKDANTWVSLAQEIFDASKTDLYLSPLVNANDLHSSVLSFTTKTGIQYYKVRAFLEDDGLRVSSTRGWITVPLDQLPDDLSPFPANLRKKISAKRLTVPDAENASLLTFTTKLGKTYQDVRASVENNGLQVVGPDGWIVVPFAQLPDDLSPFPSELRKEILAGNKTVPIPGNTRELVNFATKAGKKYVQVRVSLEDRGLQVLTEDGWIVVPFDQLPDDLTPFPLDLREQMMARRKAAAADANVVYDTVSFTTKRGKKYDHLRASLVEDGLQMLTPDGWITVPLDQLPDDLSTFPADLSKQIKMKLHDAGETNLGIDLLTFTTKAGKKYIDVRASAANEGLRVITAEGLITVPYDQLPDNLAVFPADLRKQIEGKRQTAPTPRSDTKWASFVTKKGKHFDQVRVSVANDGVRALSSEGWITVPFNQLPSDLSPFSPDLQAQIAIKQKDFQDKNKPLARAPSTLANQHHGSAVAEDPQRRSSLINKSLDTDPDQDPNEPGPEVPAQSSPKD